MQAEKIYKNSALYITNQLEKSQIKWVRLNFHNPLGFLYLISTVNSNDFTENVFSQGIY
jgi:glutamine synthetase